MEKANFGFMGLGVMGYMLALNMERNGFRVAGYDLDEEKVKSFGTGHPGKNLTGCATLEEFISILERPRRIMMMIPAGRAVDSAIDSIKNSLEPGDLLIDGGNSFFGTGIQEHHLHRGWGQRRRAGCPVGAVHYAGRTG